MTVSPFSEFSYPFLWSGRLVERPLRWLHQIRQTQLLPQEVVDRQTMRRGLCDDGLHDLRRYLLIRCRVHRVHLWLHLAYNHTSKFQTSELSSRPGNSNSSRSLRRRSADIAPGPSARRRLSIPQRERPNNLNELKNIRQTFLSTSKSSTRRPQPR